MYCKDHLATYITFNMSLKKFSGMEAANTRLIVLLQRVEDGTEAISIQGWRAAGHAAGGHQAEALRHISHDSLLYKIISEMLLLVGNPH